MSKSDSFFEPYVRAFYAAYQQTTHGSPFEQLPTTVQRAMLDGVKAVFAALDVRDGETNVSWVEPHVYPSDATEVEVVTSSTMSASERRELIDDIVGEVLQRIKSQVYPR